MLMKAIKMNYNLIKNGFQFSLLLQCMLAIICYAAGFIVSPFPLMIGGAILADYLWAANKLFGLTIFDHEASFMQTLPIDPKIAITAKAVTGALWLSLLLSINVTAVSLHSIYAVGKPDLAVSASVLHKLALKLMLSGTKEFLTAGLIALIPLILFLLSYCFCLGLITLQLLFHSTVKERSSVTEVTTITILGSMFLTAILIGGVVGANKMITMGINGAFVEIGGILLLLLLIKILLTFCSRELDTKYNLG